MRLVSVGNVMVDLVLRVRAVPLAGEDVLARNRGATVGGAFNVLAAASRQGLPAAYAGGHGTGPFGDLVREALGTEGIEILRPASAIDSGYDLALVDDDGERTFVTAFGAEARISTLPTPVPGDFVHVSGYGLLSETNVRVIEPWLGTIGDGVTVLFDPGPLAGDIPRSALDAVRARADWLSCNEREAGRLGSLDGWRHVIVRAGKAGCTVDGVRVPGFAVTAVDTTGAGDTHVGAFLAALAAGLTPLDAALRANAAAALSVTRRGPATSPTAAETAVLAP